MTKEDLIERSLRRAQVEKMDRSARDRGELVGRYIAEPFADGQAVYLITRVTKLKAHIQVVTGIGDDWVIPYWGERASIDRSYAENSVAMRDSWNSLFNKKQSGADNAK